MNAAPPLEIDEFDLIRLFERAAKIDPEAWASPLPEDLEIRRCESFKKAYEQSRN